MSDSATPKVRPRADEPVGHGDLHRLVVHPEDDVAQALVDGAPDLGLLLVEQRGRRRSSVRARAVMRTLMPSMPEARKAR